MSPCPRICVLSLMDEATLHETKKFYAQSACHHTKVEEYPFLEPEEILEDCKRHEAKKVHRYSIVTAGRALTGAEMEKALRAYRAMKKECKVELCASHGLLSQEDFNRLKEAGVGRYHANIETSRRNFPNICTTHTFEDKLEVIRRAQAAGLSVCSGGIIGMGETWEDRIDMAITLSELGIKSIPLNILRPIPGTPLEHQAALSEDEILRTIAIFRYINPTAMPSGSRTKFYETFRRASIPLRRECSHHRRYADNLRKPHQRAPGDAGSDGSHIIKKEHSYHE